MAAKVQNKKNTKSKKETEETVLDEVIVDVADNTEETVADIVEEEVAAPVEVAEEEPIEVKVEAVVEEPKEKVAEKSKKAEKKSSKDIVEPFMEETPVSQSMTAMSVDKIKEKTNKNAPKRPVMIAFGEWNGSYIL